MLLIVVSFIFNFFCRHGLGISPTVLASCGWGGTSCSAMVKDLAVAVFGRETLATHGLSGRADNANKDTTAKPALDQDKVMLILGELNVLLFFFFVQTLCYSAKL